MSFKGVFACETGDGSSFSLEVWGSCLRLQATNAGETIEVDMSVSDIEQLMSELNTHKNKLQAQEN